MTPRALFDQGAELRLIPHTILTGACWALSMKWISLHIAARAAEAQSRMDTLRNEFVGLCSSAQLVMIDIRRDVALAALEHVKKRERTIMELGVNFDLQVSGVGRHWGAESSISVGDSEINSMTDMLWTNNTYHILSFGYLTIAERHATACYCKEGITFAEFGKRIHYFDSNCGEFEVDKDEFKQLMKDNVRRDTITDFTCIPVGTR